MSERITIVGGGLVGASLALALQQGSSREREVVLIEPFEPGHEYQPSYDARSTALAYGTRLIYERLGIWPAIAECAQPITHIHVSEQGRFGMTRLNADESDVPALGYVVENAWLGHCLWQALKQTPVERYCPARATQLRAEVGGYAIELEDGRTLTSDLTVLADGGRSNLREQLGIAVNRREYGQIAIIANLTVENGHQGQAFERFTTQGPMALLPMLDNRCVLIWTRPPAEAERLLALSDAAFLSELQSEFGYRLGRLQHLGKRHTYPLALIESAEQVRSGLVVLGNAAHSLHPVAGQGYNLSLRDADGLAQVLNRSTQPVGNLSVLQHYLTQQRLDQQLTVRFSDALPRLFGQSSSVRGAVRSVGLLGLDLVAPARQKMARQAMGLGLW